MAGQSYAGGRITYRDERIDAAVMMSPNKPRLGDARDAFDEIRIPCLLMTGTRDDSLIVKGTAKDRLEVFPALTKAPAWQLVFDGATHMDFGEREAVIRKKGQSRYHKAILALSTAFWDSNLKQDKAAKKWLEGDGVKTVLVKEDVWEANGL